MRKSESMGAAEVVLQDYISNIAENLLNILGIGGFREMSEDVLGFVLVELDEFALDIFGSGLKIAISGIVREKLLHVVLLQLLLEQVDLVEEQDDARVHKPLAVTNFVEKVETFLEPVCCIVLVAFLVVLAK